MATVNQVRPKTRTTTRKIRGSIPARPIPAAPIYLDEASLDALWNYTNPRERLGVTSDYIVYYASSGALQMLRKGLGANAHNDASQLVENTIRRLRVVESDDHKTILIPRSSIMSVNADVYYRHKPNFLFTRRYPYFYYTISLSPNCKLHFLQQPSKSKSLARSAFKKMTKSLMGREGRWRVAELGIA